jgi:hypothetical protein
LLLAVLPLGCGAASSPVAEVPKAEAQTPLPTDDHRCDGEKAPMLWDDAAKACRLFPKGGYGTAGCSQHPEPTIGTCFTGTSWRDCDCVCDSGKQWDVSARACK